MADEKPTTKKTAKKQTRQEVEAKLRRKKIADFIWSNDDLKGIILADGTQVLFDKVSVK